jgi:hypothetical protein
MTPKLQQRLHNSLVIRRDVVFPDTLGLLRRQFVRPPVGEAAERL